MQVEVRRFCFFRRPDAIGMPRVRPALERAGLPRKLLARTMQVITEEWRFDILAELARGLVSAKRDQADAFAFGRLPFSVKPGTSDDEIRVLRIILFGVAKNLPRSPRVFLIPESGDVQIRHG